MDVLRRNRVVVWLVLPALLLFAVQSSFEVFHPIEEGHQAAEQYRLQDGAAVDSLGESEPEHDHGYCPHSNAVAHIGSLETAFHPLLSVSPKAGRTSGVVARAPLSVLERGPPAL